MSYHLYFVEIKWSLNIVVTMHAADKRLNSLKDDRKNFTNYMPIAYSHWFCSIPNSKDLNNFF